MDAATMARLHAASFTRGWSEAEIETLLAKPTIKCVTNEHGFALVQVIPPEAELLTIVIDPAHRGQGHGHTILGQTLAAAHNAGAATLMLDVDSTNIPALALYRRLDFTQTGQRRGYYRHADGTQSDAVLMARPTTTPNTAR
ncbi:GNAT family N-acetyltransferase [Gymnodinialimonas sp. 2305UL16-5]|uniref:GNAT family N-acetyltransferase n=1 Tax=Gymnodinialimonas mytili TaxID=3126503 RepID=UPI0030981F43